MLSILLSEQIGETVDISQEVSLFVYGSLMHGQANGEVIPEDLIVKRQLARMYAEGLYFNYSKGFPVIVVNNKTNMKNTSTVIGEIITLKNTPSLVKLLLEKIENFEIIKSGVLVRDSGYAFPLVGGASVSTVFYNVAETYKKLITTHHFKIIDGNFRRYIKPTSHDSKDWLPRGLLT